MATKLQLLPGVGFTHNGERWVPAQIDRAAHLTAVYVDVVDIGETKYAVFEDDRKRRWAKQASVVEGEQGHTWSTRDLPSEFE